MAELTSRRFAGTLALLAVLPVPLGCSYLFVKGPARDTRSPTSVGPAAECTSTYEWPLVDAGLTVLSLLWFSSGVYSWSSNNSFSSGAPAVLGGAAGVALAGSSAVVGYGRITSCREHKR